MTDEKITVLAKIKAKEAMADTVKQQALALVKPTRSEAGCISYDLHQSDEDENLFMFYENWISKKALDEHIQTPHLQTFIAKAGELLAGALDVSIWKKIS